MVEAHGGVELTQLVFYAMLASFVVILVFRALRIPEIPALIVTGVMLSAFQNDLGFQEADVKEIGMFGVKVLLFTIGLHVDIGSFAKRWKVLLISGFLQIHLTILGAAAAMWLFGTSFEQGIFMGFLLSASSSALVLKALSDDNALGTRHGQFTAGILVLQDLWVIPFTILTPMLGGGIGSFSEFAQTSAIAAVGLIGGGVLIYYVVPGILTRVIKLHDDMLFHICVICVFIGMAVAFEKIGLSAELGAFLAGLGLSSCEYKHHLNAKLAILKDSFGSMFFVAIGMLISVDYLRDNFPTILLVWAAVMVLKWVTGAISTMACKAPLGVGIMVGGSLAQIGEFSFVLAQVGITYNLLAEENYQLFLSVGILGMILTPIQMAIGMKLRNGRYKEWTPFRKGDLPAVTVGKMPDLQDHVIVVGAGRNGTLAMDHLAQIGVPFAVIEQNPDQIHALRKEDGHTSVFGSAADDEILLAARIKGAKVMLITVPDYDVAIEIIRAGRELNPGILIVVRAMNFMGREALEHHKPEALVCAEEAVGPVLIDEMVKAIEGPKEAVAA